MEQGRRNTTCIALTVLTLFAGSSCASLKAKFARFRGEKAKLVNGRILAAAEINPSAGICMRRATGFLGREFTEDQKQTLCQAASQEEPAAPLMCFEKAALDLSELTLSDDQRIQLCSGVSFEPMSPIDCLSEADDYLGKGVSPAQKVRLCAGAPEHETSPLLCYERSEHLLGRKLTVDQRVNLCSGAPEDALSPLQCFSRAEGIKGAKLSDDDKVHICARSG